MKYFTDKELACRHCGAVKYTDDLAKALDTFRAEVGLPVVVVSGYRCPEHNKAVGGAPRSEHVMGQAADIKVEGYTAAMLEAVAKRVPRIRGIGRDDYKGYLHIDVRTVPARWCYEPSGKWCKYYPPADADFLPKVEGQVS